MKIKRLLLVLFAVLITLSAVLPCANMNVSAAAAPGIIFDCVYSQADSMLTVTASVSNPDIDVNTAMFVLDYDKNLLTADKSKVSFASGATESAVYFNEGHIGADWYYQNGLQKSSTASPTVTVEFSVKKGTSLNDLKAALSICDDTDYLNSIGGYGVDGGVLLCVSSSEYYNAAQSTATAKFNFSEEQPAVTNPKLIFDSVYYPDKKELVTTVSVKNPDNKVGAAMFVLKYDSSLITPKASGSVSYLENANESKTYTNSTSNYIGADWYYSTAIPASSSSTEAVQLVFDVADGAALNDLKNALSVCTDTSYLGSIGYKDDGGILICENGTVFFNAADKTAEAVFNYDEDESQPVSYTITVTDGTAKVGDNTATTAKAGDTVTITANAPADGYKFKEWQVVSGSLTLASATSSTTTFTMPAANLSLKAVYEKDSSSTKYTIIVTNGTAKVDGQTAGLAKPGDVVVITANDYDSYGNPFKKWSVNSGNITLDNSNAATTTFVMPASNVSVTAKYDDAKGPVIPTGESATRLYIAIAGVALSVVMIAVLLYLKQRKKR